MKAKKRPSYIQSATVSNEKALLIREIKEAVESLKLIRQGKLAGMPARELLRQL